MWLTTNEPNAKYDPTSDSILKPTSTAKQHDVERI